MSVSGDRIQWSPYREYKRMQVLPGFMRRMVERGEREGERGQGLVEYGFILVLIAVFVILSLQLLGHQTNNLYSNIANGLNQ